MLSCVLGACAGWAQAPVDGLMSHQAWSTEEGLPDASVHGILQSRVGYLWVATERGAARFDGSSFQVFKHETEPAFASDDLSAMAEDGAGDLWFGTADGLVERHGGVFRRLGEAEGLPSERILSVAAAGDGAVLVLTSGGLALVRNGVVQLMSAGLGGTLAGIALRGTGGVRGLAQTGDGAVRLLLRGGAVLRYANGRVTREPQEPALPEGVVDEVTGTGGVHWIRTAHEVYAVAGGVARRVWPGFGEAGRSRVTALLPDPQGKVWVGTTHGLFRVAAQPGGQPQMAEALRNDAVLTLMWDREGDLWVGTEGSGLHVLRPRAFRSEAAALGEAVTSVAGAEDGSVWFGTRESGVEHVFADGHVESVPVAKLLSPRVLSLAAGLHRDAWVGTPDGLNHVSAQGAVRGFTSADGLPDDFVRTVAVDSDGVLWAGTRRGLVGLRKEGMRVFTVKDGLPSDSIGPLLAGAPGTGQLWVGTSAGLALLRGDHVVPLNGATVGDQGIVTALAEDGAGGLWVAMHGRGLFRWWGERMMAVDNAALPREITGLLVDSGGRLWLRAPRTIVSASARQLLACAQRAKPCAATVESFGAADGMPSDELAAEGSPQIAGTANGELWFATRKGLALADPGNLPRSTVAPPVVVQRFTVDGVTVDEASPEIRLRPGHSRYVFDYAALSYRLPSKVHYRYRLEGFDRDWVDAGTARSAVYTGLSPRVYRFQVLAASGSGPWSEPGATLRFRVLTPIYRRWWFFALILLAAGLLVWGMLRLRDRTVQRRFALVLQERNRMAREIHDTLAQDFVSVSLQLDLLSSHLRGAKYDQAATQLQATRVQVKEGLQAARQSIWNLRANAGEDSLPTRLSTMAARFSFGGKPPQVSIGGAFRKLPSTVEEEVLRIAGEALSNAHRHAGADEVKVELRYEAEQLRLQVEDNGRGFVPAVAREAEGHYGLRGMQERAAALRADFRMDSSPDGGTTVRLRVPLRGKEASQG